MAGGTQPVVKQKQQQKTAAVHVTDIGVRIEGDWQDPWITGSVVLPGDKLVIVDHGNARVKLINLHNNEVVSHLKCDSTPWDITAVTNSEVAVTCPAASSTIWLIKVTNTLTVNNKVAVKGKCRGIACIRDKFVITYCGPAKIEIMRRTGELLQTVITEERGRQLFSTPWYVAVSPDQQTLYTSDCNRATVTSLDLQGQVIATHLYKDDQLHGPCGLAVDKDGLLYVCGYLSQNVLQLTPDLHTIQTLLQTSDGIVWPQSVSYSGGQHKLYIGRYIVKVYQLH